MDERKVRNVDGNEYTLGEWLTAADRQDTTSQWDLRAAWSAGEAPADYTTDMELAVSETRTHRRGKSKQKHD